MTFIPPGEKISIGSIDEPTEENSVSAQYNPKELQIDKSVPWQKHNKANANGLQLEFTGAEGRTMSVELLFDGYEEHESIQGQVAKLEMPLRTSACRYASGRRQYAPRKPSAQSCGIGTGIT